MKRCINCFQEFDSSYDVCPNCGYYAGKEPMELYHLFPGTILAGRYQIGQVLGFGGFGITYKAWDKKLETVVAIKEYYPSGLVNRIPGDKEVILFAAGKVNEFNYGLKRFLDEAKNTAKFSSNKNIVHVFEYFEENNTAYIVMEFLDGIPLSQFLKENKMDVPSSIETINCIFTALKEIHSQGIIHRDVSPDNIFLCFNGNVKLIDFGAARFSTNEEKQLTIILKPGFAPPEQYEKISAQGPWTDVYAVGATLYYMLTGVKPDESTDRKSEDHLIPPHEINPEISENTSNAIMKAMALEKPLRFSSVEEFEKAVNGEKKVTTLAKEKKRRKRNRLISILAALVVLSVAVFVLSSSLMRQKEAETLPAATISVWYEITGNIALDTAKQQALTAIAEDFMKSFPDITIEIAGNQSESYQTDIEEAVREGEKPRIAIFESTTLPSDFVNAVAENVGVKDIENAKGCFFLSEYLGAGNSQNKLPIGYIKPVLYCNTTKVDVKPEDVNSYESLLGYCNEDVQIAINGSAKAYISSAWGADFFAYPYVVTVEDSSGFAAGEYAFYISGSDEFITIQQKLPGRYCISSIDSGNQILEFSDSYSVCQGLTSDERRVAFALINYFLSDNAQDEFFIQNWTGHLPYNSNALQIVEDVYNDFSGLLTEGQKVNQ